LLPPLAQRVGRWIPYWLDVEIVEFPVDRSVAYLAGICGDWEACDRFFAQALREVRGLGRPSSVARMKFELGDLRVRCGHDVARAGALIAEARAEAAQAGLDELVALVDRRHGQAPRPVTRPPFRSPSRRFTIVREGEYYAIDGGSGPLRFTATRGFQYLARLVERAGADVHVLELIGATDADRGDAGEVVDDRALQAYRQRADQLRDALEDADARGDVDGAERARSELEALATELSRGAGLGGKPRRSESAVDRARSAVQRRIKDALDRVAGQDAELGAWLRRVVHTGNHCSFQGGL
jgi:hypothetical protein